MGWTSFVRQEMGLGQNDPVRIQKYKKRKKYRRCRGSNPGHPRDRREYLPLYYNDLMVALELSNIISSFLSLGNIQRYSRYKKSRNTIMSL